MKTSDNFSIFKGIESVTYQRKNNSFIFGQSGCTVWKRVCYERSSATEFVYAIKTETVLSFELKWPER